MPAMLCGEQEMCRQGFIFRNINSVCLKQVSIVGVDGEAVTAENVKLLENKEIEVLT